MSPGSFGGQRHGVLVRASVQRPVTVLMLVVTLFVVGILAYRSVPLQLAPSGITGQSISVFVPVVDSTPEEVMDVVAEPAEEMLRTITGVTRITSTSSSNSCRLRVSYGDGVDGDAIYADVRDRMERLLPSLPEGADRYRIFRFNIDSDFPIMSVAASYDDDVAEPDTMLDKVVKSKLEAIPGIARVEIQGLFKQVLLILLDPDQVTAYGVDLQTLVQRLRGDNFIEPGGIIREGGRRHLVRLSSRFENFEEIRNYRVTDSLVLGDIATLEARRTVRFLARVDGKRCNVISISKESEANTVETCREVSRVLEEELPRDPRLDGFHFYAYFSQGEMIENSISSLQQTCAWGGLFAILVLYLFLRRLPITLTVACAIPLSLTLAVVVIFFRGGTFNLLSLTGLTLGIGMLIDNAIVIAENIFRHRELGLPAREAAARGVKEVALAVTLATLTTVAVFLPIIFLSGESNLRILLGELGLPVCYSLLASLLVALVFIPIATVYFGGRAGDDGTYAVKGGALIARGQRLYRRFLGWSLEHRFAAVLICFAGFLTFMVPNALMEKFGQNDAADHEIHLWVECPPYFTLRDTDEAMEKIRLSMEPQRDALGIETMACWFDANDGTFMFIIAPEVRRSRKAFIEEAQKHLPRLAGVKIHVGGENEDERDKEIYIEARGRDPRILNGLLSRVGDSLRDDPEVLGVMTPDRRGQDEIHVNVSRERAQRFQVSPSSVTSLVAWAMRGAPLPDYQTEDGEMEFWISYEDNEMTSLGDLYKVPVFSNTGTAVPLANLAEFSVGRTMPPIRRRDGKVSTHLRITARKDVNEVQLEKRVRAMFASLDVPDGYELVVRGSTERLEEGLRDLIQAVLLGAILIFVLMGVLFESFILPLSVLFSTPFLYVGAAWSAFVFQEGVSESSFIGFVILLGIVVNNGIVLIDCVNRFRTSIANRTEAILQAGEARLRPIVMTACTTIFGLAPLIFIPQTGSGLSYRPIAVVVMGGLVVCTLSTLIVVPLLYTLLDDLRGVMLAGLRRGLFKQRGVVPPPLPQEPT